MSRSRGLHRGLPQACGPLCCNPEDKGQFSRELVFLLFKGREGRMSTPNTPPSSEVARTYRRPIPNTWWLKQRSTLLFMIREWSSVFVALYAICLLGQLWALSEGAESYKVPLAKSLSGASLVLHLVMGVFVLY